MTISEMFESERKKKRDAFNALENLTREEKIRAVNPGLRELWEQYQTMLALVDNGTAEDDIQEHIYEESASNMLMQFAGDY